LASTVIGISTFRDWLPGLCPGVIGNAITAAWWSVAVAASFDAVSVIVVRSALVLSGSNEAVTPLGSSVAWKSIGPEEPLSRLTRMLALTDSPFFIPIPGAN
jgi:hypothetical protein